MLKITRNGQITLPADFRKAFELEEGDYLEPEITEDALILRPITVAYKKAKTSK